MTPPSRLSAAAADVRSLGPWAPVRAAYEVAKRTGGHRLVFNAIARLPVPNVVVTPPFAAPPADAVPPAARERCLVDAAEICDGRLRLFGDVFADQEPPDWHSVLHRPGRWPVRPWWEIDLRSSTRPGDVKWVWELGRHRHLVVLARAAYLEPDNERWLSTLSSQLRSWLTDNAPEIGINWYSNLEISLRALGWLQVVALVGPRLDSSLLRDMSGVLYRSARHLVADLPYTLSSMRNNHLLGDGLGLAALGRSFPGVPAATRWAHVGDRLFRSQLRRHMRGDGSMIEDSVSYHRFVLEMLAMRVLLGGAVTAERAALAGAAQFLCRLGALEGAVPTYGDWDEGRVLASSGHPLDLVGSTRLALSLAGSGSPASWRSNHDEVAWYSREGEPLEPDRAERAGHSIGGGLSRLVAGRFTCWLKAGSAPSHGHADLCSIALALDDSWVVGDPGTGNYNSDAAERDYFRSSLAHNVLRIDGHDQLVALRPFRWRYAAEGVTGAPVSLPAGVLAWGFHDAYCRLEPPRRVCRVIIARAGGVVVADWVEGAPGCRYELSLPLGPEARWDGRHITLAGGSSLHLTLPGEATVVHGGAGSLPGGWSPTYGKVVPATVLQLSGVVDGPVAWQVSLAAEPAFRTVGEYLVDDSGTRLTVRWTPAAPRLHVEGSR